MDFDALTRTIAKTIDRRGAFGRLVASLVAVGVPGAVDDSLAKRRPNRPKHKDCKRDEKRCHDRCIQKSKCCTNTDCQGGGVCADGACLCPVGTQTCGLRCIPRDQCCTNTDCGACSTCQAGTCVTGCGVRQTCQIGQCVCDGASRDCGGTCIPATGCCTDAECGETASCCNHQCQADFTLAFGWGSEGDGDDQFNFPQGVAVDRQTGQVYVADTFNDRVRLFSANGTLVGGWGGSGTGPGQFSAPGGIAVAQVGGQTRVFVTEQDNHRLQVFTAVGTPVTMWGSQGDGETQFYQPVGVAVFGNKVYVADEYNNRIQVFTTDGTPVTRWGTFGTLPGQFDHPVGIAVDGNGRVYVTDTRDPGGSTANNRIQVFQADGTPVTMWGSSGNGNGQFNIPAGITVSESGVVYVADSDNNRVQVFTTTGSFLTRFGSLGSGPGQLEFPVGLAFAASGALYVADEFNSRVQVFTPSTCAPVSTSKQVSAQRDKKRSDRRHEGRPEHHRHRKNRG